MDVMCEMSCVSVCDVRNELCANERNELCVNVWGVKRAVC